MKKQVPESKKTTLKGCLLMIILVIIGCFIWRSCMGCNSEETTPLTKEQIRENTIKKQFSAWDGSHINLTKKIKEHLNDPKSYEHIKTTYRDLDSVLMISTEFTAKNTFNGTLRKKVVVKSDTTGNIIEIYQWFD